MELAGKTRDSKIGFVQYIKPLPAVFDAKVVISHPSKAAWVHCGMILYCN